LNELSTLSSPQVHSPALEIIRADIKCLPSCKVFAGTNVKLDGTGSSPPGGAYLWTRDYYGELSNQPSILANYSSTFNLRYCYPADHGQCDSKSVDVKILEPSQILKDLGQDIYRTFSNIIQSYHQAYRLE
jgi:hypothetical protein